MPALCQHPCLRGAQPTGENDQADRPGQCGECPPKWCSRLQAVLVREQPIWNGGAVRKSAERRGRKRWERSVILFDHPQLSPALTCFQCSPFLLPHLEAHLFSHCLNPILKLEMLLPFLASPKLGGMGCDLSPRNLLHLPLALDWKQEKWRV